MGTPNSATAWLMLDLTPSKKRETRERWADEVMPALAAGDTDEAIRAGLEIFREEREHD